VLLYGRRRVGKTRLIQEFMKDKRGLYFYVPNAEEKTVLAEFSRVVESEFFEGFRFVEYLSSNSGFKSRPRTKIRDRPYIHGFSITDAWDLRMEIW